MEGLRLRVQEIEFSKNEIIVRDGKGAKERFTMLPESLKSPLHELLKQVKTVHEKDLARMSAQGLAATDRNVGRKNQSVNRS